jgi:hypothetical protein
MKREHGWRNPRPSRPIGGKRRPRRPQFGYKYGPGGQERRLYGIRSMAFAPGEHPSPVVRWVPPCRRVESSAGPVRTPSKAQRARRRAHFAAPPGLALHNQDPYAPCLAPQCSLPPYRPCGPKKRSTRATHTEGQAHPRSGNKHRNHPPHTEIWGWRGVGGGLTARIMGFRHADDPAHTSAKWDAPGPTGRGQQKRARPRSPPSFSTRNTPHRLFVGSPRRRREGGEGAHFWRAGRCAGGPAGRNHHAGRFVTGRVRAQHRGGGWWGLGPGENLILAGF